MQLLLIQPLSKFELLKFLDKRIFYLHNYLSNIQHFSQTAFLISRLFSISSTSYLSPRTILSLILRAKDYYSLSIAFGIAEYLWLLFCILLHHICFHQNAFTFRTMVFTYWIIQEYKRSKWTLNILSLLSKIYPHYSEYYYSPKWSILILLLCLIYNYKQCAGHDQVSLHMFATQKSKHKQALLSLFSIHISFIHSAGDRTQKFMYAKYTLYYRACPQFTTHLFVQLSIGYLQILLNSIFLSIEMATMRFSYLPSSHCQQIWT